MVKAKLPDWVVIAEVTITDGDDEKEVLKVVGVIIAVVEAIVDDGDVCLYVDVSIGVVDAYVSFVVVCIVEDAVLAVVIFARGEAKKYKQKWKGIKWYSQTNADRLQCESCPLSSKVKTAWNWNV